MIIVCEGKIIFVRDVVICLYVITKYFIRGICLKL